MVLSENTLQNCWDNNSDGAGFMYAEKGKLHIMKGYFTYDEFRAAYDPHKEKKVVLHFRIRTHGDINEDNCHPYVVDKNLAFIHNGIISKVECSSDKSMSDTWHFCEQYLKPLRQQYTSFFKDPIIQTFIEEFIGYSKLVFLNSKGEHTIMNEEKGNWDAECWFSNTSYKMARNKVTTQVTPYKRETELLAIDDVCWVAHETHKFKFGEYVIIKYVYADNTVGVYKADNPKVEDRVHASSLYKTSIFTKAHYDKEKVFKSDFQPGDFATFTRNYNHFRKNDDVWVESIDGDFVQVTDYAVADDRTYKVPKYMLAPANDMDYIDI